MSKSKALCSLSIAKLNRLSNEIVTEYVESLKKEDYRVAKELLRLGTKLLRVLVMHHNLNKYDYTRWIIGGGLNNQLLESEELEIEALNIKVGKVIEDMEYYLIRDDYNDERIGLRDTIDLLSSMYPKDKEDKSFHLLKILSNPERTLENNLMWFEMMNKKLTI
jgi:hypothetical protein